MEKLDVYDEIRRRTGKTISRGAALSQGERLVVVHVCIFNSKGEMLIQQRSFQKDKYPGCWDVSAGGFVRSGESSSQAALRETSEELGLCLSEDKLSFVHTEAFSYVLDDFYAYHASPEPSSLHIQRGELESVKWAGLDEIISMIGSGTFVDYSESLIRLVYDKAASLQTDKPID